MSLSIVSALLSSAEFFERLCDVWLKAGLLLLAAASISLLFRRTSAATRHSYWSAAVAVLGLLPLAAAVLPAWRLPVPSPWPADARHAALSTTPEAPAAVKAPGVIDAAFARADRPGANSAVADLPRSASPAASSSAAIVAPSASTWRLWFSAAWLAGVAGALAPLAAGLASLRRLRARCSQPTRGPLVDALRSLEAQLGSRRTVTLLESEARSIPMTWGLIRPVIVLPKEAETWPAERLRSVLLHELAHVARCDWLTQMLAHGVRAFYWFNPLAWLAAARMRALQEQACDDLVLGIGVNAEDYAEQLLAVTSGRRVGRSLAAAGLAIGRVNRLERRLRAILDPHRNRRALARRHVLCMGILALVVASPLASVSLKSAAAEPEAGRQRPAEAPPAAPEVKASDEADPKGESARLEELRAKILAHYSKKSIDGRTLTAGAIKGMLAALDDPYSKYLSPEEMRKLDSQVQGKLTGIGAKLAMEGPAAGGGDPKAQLRPTVITPLENSPALKAGMQPGDVILAIDGRLTAGRELSEVLQLIAGEAGTAVRIKVRHLTGEEVELAITRSAITLATVEGLRRDAQERWSYWLDSEAKIGYVRLLQFGPTTPDEIRTAMEELVKQNLKGLVLDVRFCAGGLLAGSVETCKLFVSPGAIVSVKALDQPAQELGADGAGPFADLPLVVLINEQTASAAEILAGSLQDRGRAVAVGSRTFGKASVQSIVKLGEEGAGLLLTTAYYYLPSGRSLDRNAGAVDWGVEPNDGFFVPLGPEQARRLLELRQQRELLGKPAGEAPVVLERLTPERIEQDFADAQLSAALKTMLARLAAGEFLKVGESKAEARRRHDQQIAERRRALVGEFERLQRELAELDKAVAAPSPPAKP